jgi:hypothetical protein
MKKFLLLSFFASLFIAGFVPSQQAVAQNQQTDSDGLSLTVGVHYGQSDQSVGLGVGVIRPDVGAGSLSYGSFSFMRRQPGVETWGEKFDNIGQREFRQDIVDTGRRIDFFALEVGMKVLPYTHAIASFGYESTSLVQQRDDDTTILGDNGRYWTDYRISQESGLSVGGGVLFYIPITESVAIMPSVRGSTAKTIVLSISFGANVI